MIYTKVLYSLIYLYFIYNIFIYIYIFIIKMSNNGQSTPSFLTTCEVLAKTDFRVKRT